MNNECRHEVDVLHPISHNVAICLVVYSWQQASLYWNNNYSILVYITMVALPFALRRESAVCKQF